MLVSAVCVNHRKNFHLKLLPLLPCTRYLCKGFLETTGTLHKYLVFTSLSCIPPNTATSCWARTQKKTSVGVSVTNLKAAVSGNTFRFPNWNTRVEKIFDLQHPRHQMKLSSHLINIYLVRRWRNRWAGKRTEKIKIWFPEPTRGLTIFCYSSSSGSKTSFGLWGPCEHMVHRYTM